MSTAEAEMPTHENHPITPSTWPWPVGSWAVPVFWLAVVLLAFLVLELS